MINPWRTEKLHISDLHTTSCDIFHIFTNSNEDKIHQTAIPRTYTIQHSTCRISWDLRHFLHSHVTLAFFRGRNPGPDSHPCEMIMNNSWFFLELFMNYIHEMFVKCSWRCYELIIGHFKIMNFYSWKESWWMFMNIFFHE